MKQVLIELDVIWTRVLFVLLDLLGSGGIGCTLRALILRVLGFRVGPGVKLAHGVTIHRSGTPLTIGAGSFVNKHVFFDTLSPVTIGKHCDIGYHCIFATSSHVLQSNYKTRRKAEPMPPIVLEDFVWLGARVTVLGGVTIGRGAFVAANSLVTKDIPPNAIAMGSPAKVVRYIGE